MFQNLATGQILNTCDFFAYISSINWCSCTTDEVWLGNGTAKSGYDWFMYFQTNTPTCADQAPTCMSVHINDADQPGETLYVLSYPAIGIPTPTKTYQWEQSTDGVTWSPIGGATSTSFVITNAQVGKYVRVKGTATNGIGSPAVCYSGAVPIVPANASPTNTIAPVISGGTTQGSVLTCTTGTWDGFPTPTFSFTWFANGVQVGTGNTYTLNLSDSLKNITCVVTANNGINPNGTATSNTITAGDYAPQNLTAPTISGGTTLGSTLTCSVGTWSGTNITYNYQWFSGALPVGDNSAQYQLQLTDTLANITCVVTAVNPAGSNSATSNTITAGNFAPYNTIIPNIYVIGGGPANPGVTLECQVGTWVGYGLSYSFQWYRGATPVGTNTDTYLVTLADQGQSITCEVTATNLGGSGTATSNNINVPSGPGVSAPSNSTPPIISVAGGGSPYIGETLAVHVGTWNGTSPIAYTYEWFSGMVSVGTDPSYILQSSDYGDSMTCVVTATNAYGVASQVSNTIIAVGSAPVNTIPPAIIGNNTPGDVLSLNLGTWNASPAISSYNYLWQYSADNGVTWNNYSPSQTGATKVVLTSDVGRLVRCHVTATNVVGSGVAYSDSQLIDSAPINVTAPVISGTTLVGSVLTTTDGVWTGSGTITYTYRWLRNGVAIVGATTNTYTTISTDAGANIQSEVTATNGIGPSIRTSNIIVPTIAPSVSAGPIVYGSYSLGSTLFVSNGYYTAYPAVTITRVWQLSTDGGLTWNNIVGATGTTYVVQAGDVGNQIRVLETATNSEGTVNSTSNVATITAIPVQRPDNSAIPTLSGNPYIGQVLTTNNGTWLNSPTSFTYQWFRENRFGNVTPVAISGATSTTYTLVTADTNCVITCRVTATNAGGSEVAISSEIYAYDADFYSVITFATAQGYTLPTTAQQQHFSRMVKELKDNSMWSIMDRFWFMANNGSANFGRINWVSPSTGTLLTLVNSPTWTSNVGFISTGTSYIDTQYNPSTQGVNYTLNNAGRYCFITQRASVSGNINIDGANINTNTNVMYVSTGQNNHHINQGTNTGAGINTSCNGYHSITRTGASTSSRGTDLMQSLNIASTVVFNGNQHIMRSAQVAAASGNGFGFYCIGAGMSDVDVAKHRSIINKYITNL